MNYSVIHENKRIYFSVEFRNRRSTAIHVHRDQSVRVLAPKHLNRRALEKIVAGRAPWILKKQSEFSNLPVSNSVYIFIDGEMFSYLGKPHRLELKEGKPSVEMTDNSLIMTAPESYDTGRRKKLLQKWYRRQADIIFPDRLAACMKTVSAAGIKKTPELKSRVLKRSWGSCSARGRINLNLELVSAPIECIDYVILHELCHLVEQNHSPRFYSLLIRVCPDWKSLRKKLNDNYRTMLV